MYWGNQRKKYISVIVYPHHNVFYNTENRHKLTPTQSEREWSGFVCWGKKYTNSDIISWQWGHNAI